MVNFKVNYFEGTEEQSRYECLKKIYETAQHIVLCIGIFALLCFLFYGVFLVHKQVSVMPIEEGTDPVLSDIMAYLCYSFPVTGVFLLGIWLTTRLSESEFVFGIVSEITGFKDITYKRYLHYSYCEDKDKGMRNFIERFKKNQNVTIKFQGIPNHKYFDMIAKSEDVNHNLCKDQHTFIGYDYIYNTVITDVIMDIPEGKLTLPVKYKADAMATVEIPVKIV